MVITPAMAADGKPPSPNVGTTAAPTASFKSDVTTGASPLTVHFTDTSTNTPNKWRWSFGDGKFSDDKNPVHTYTSSSARDYTVSLTVWNSRGSNTVTKTQYIHITPPPVPEASFTSDVPSGISPLTVHFTDTSTNSPNKWRWFFGDGTFSDEKNPVHTYTSSRARHYTVSLKVWNDYGSDRETKTQYIFITPPPVPKASFKSDVTSGISPLTVHFTDTSTNSPNKWSWSFGDGTVSTDENPVHTYTSSSAKSYTVSLTVWNNYGSDKVTKVRDIWISGGCTAADSGQACDTGKQGVCSAGTTQCTNGKITCVQNQQPSAEVCDGLDNDCDGVVDNGNPGGGIACSTGLLGVCAAGTTQCSGGALVCNENKDPSPEVCDGLDNDCSGQVDDGIESVSITCGTGACAGTGTQTCVNGAMQGSCSPMPTGTVCGSPGSACQNPDTCDGNGQCQTGGFAPAGTSCDDGLYCNGIETCSGNGVCLAGTPPTLDDGISCTTDSCDEATHQVKHTPDNSVCDDGKFCDGAETCSITSGCVAGTPPKLDDGIPCTTDSCDEATHQIKHTPNDAVCDDGKFCDGIETCSPSVGCQAGTPPKLDDGIPCTTDSCDEATHQIKHTPNDAACDDGIFCNGAETCSITSGCQAGTPPTLDDNNLCTTDSCDEASRQVKHIPISCDDGNPGTIDSCDPAIGCVHVAKVQRTLTGLVMESGGGTISMLSPPNTQVDSMHWTYNDGTDVVMDATPAVSSGRVDWSGSCDSVDTDNKCHVLMNRDRTVTAFFEYPITILKTGTGTGTVTGSGADCGATCTAWNTYFSDTVLTATPDAGSEFAGWSGCYQVSGNSCSVYPGQQYQVTATFSKVKRTLAVSVMEAGAGTISPPDPLGTYANGVWTYDDGTDVVIGATPTDPSGRVDWGNTCDSVDTNNKCHVRMNADRNVYAWFYYPTTVTKAGTGTGTVTGGGADCGATCTVWNTYFSGFSFWATPDAGSEFAGWSGCYQVSGNSCSVYPGQQYQVTATFNKIKRTLTVSPMESGGGTASPLDPVGTPAGLNKWTYDDGTDVVIGGTPTYQSGRVDWSGSCDSVDSDNKCHVLMNRDRSVTAYFYYPITILKTGTGTGTVTGSGADCGATCTAWNTYFSETTFMATPDAGSNFAGWSGCDQASGTSCTVYPGHTFQVTATFNKVQRTLTGLVMEAGGGTISTPSPAGTPVVGYPNRWTYDDGTDVVIGATPTVSSGRVDWMGSCDSVDSDNKCHVQMHSDRIVTAYFEYPITVTKAGTGTGTVTGSGMISGIDCGATCTGWNTYFSGTTLWGTPDAGSIFAGWTGCDQASGTRCNVYPGVQQQVTATFNKQS